MSDLAAWNLRSHLHRYEVHPKLAAAGVDNGGITSCSSIEKTLGQDTFFAILNMTNGAQVGIQRTFNHIEKTSKKFIEFLRAEYLGEKFSSCDASENFCIQEEIKEIVPPGANPKPYAPTIDAGLYKVSSPR